MTVRMGWVLLGVAVYLYLMGAWIMVGYVEHVRRRESLPKNERFWKTMAVAALSWPIFWALTPPKKAR